MKKIHTIACGIVSLSILTFLANNSTAQNCYGPEAMYGEGPVYECQKKAGPIKLSKYDLAKDHGEMLAEGPVSPTKIASQHIINRLAVKRTSYSSDLANMWTEGISYSTSNESVVLALAKEKAIKTQPAAGQK